MFVHNRPLFTVLAPLALLLAVALWSNSAGVPKSGTVPVAAADRGVARDQADPARLTAANRRAAAH